MFKRPPVASTPTPKTLGPFTGRQLTTIICVVVVIVLFPVASWAVAGSPVFLTDPHNNHHAAIDAAGNVQTSAPGNVSSTDSFVESHTVQLTTSFAPLLTADGKELIVTDVHMDWSGASTQTVSYAAMTLGDAGTCANTSTSVIEYFSLPTTFGTHDAQFTPGYIVPTGKSLCVEKFGVSNPLIDFSAFGYSVPKGSVAAPI